MSGPFIRRVTIRNCKSIAACRVDLGPLMFLVGPNGSGKSHFLDARRFVADALHTSLDFALRDRGSIEEVRRRSGGHPTHFAIRLDFALPGDQTGHYSFRVGAKPAGGFEVQAEECRVRDVMHPDAYFMIERGAVRAASFQPTPPPLCRIGCSWSRLPELPSFGRFSTDYPPLKSITSARPRLAPGRTPTRVRF
jgi:hypothetical protein